MSSTQEQREVPSSENTAPQVPKQASSSQSVSQPENSENKDRAVNLGGAENQENAEKTMNQGRRGTAAIMEDHHVSREALKGPQGQAPRTAEEFEKESKTGKPAERSQSGKLSPRYLVRFGQR